MQSDKFKNLGVLVLIMENNQFSKIRALIKGIERDNEELNNYMLHLLAPTRAQILKEIFEDIIKNNTILKNDASSKDVSQDREGKREEISMENYVANLVSNIKNNSSKKVIILREFLNNVSEILESDKNVILQSLKNEKEENLAEKVLNLLKIFKLSSK